MQVSALTAAERQDRLAATIKESGSAVSSTSTLNSGSPRAKRNGLDRQFSAFLTDVLGPVEAKRITLKMSKPDAVSEADVGDHPPPKLAVAVSPTAAGGGGSGAFESNPSQPFQTEGSYLLLGRNATPSDGAVSPRAVATPTKTTRFEFADAVIRNVVEKAAALPGLERAASPPHAWDMAPVPQPPTTASGVSVRGPPRKVQVRAASISSEAQSDSSAGSDTAEPLPHGAADEVAQLRQTVEGLKGVLRKLLSLVATTVHSAPQPTTNLFMTSTSFIVPHVQSAAQTPRRAGAARGPGAVLRRQSLKFAVPPTPKGSNSHSPSLPHTDSTMSVMDGQHARTNNEAAVDEDPDDGSIMVNQYQLIQPIGHGSQASVWLAVDTVTNATRAVKVMQRPHLDGVCSVRMKLESSRKAAALLREVAIMKRCRHRNIVTLYEVIDDPAAQAMYLVMQFIEHGPVLKFDDSGNPLHSIASTKLVHFARQLCAGLVYLHRHDVVHRDIKPENILLGANDTVFLTDFGVSTFNETKHDDPAKQQMPPSPHDGDDPDPFVKSIVSRVSTQGTLAYMSPEIHASRCNQESIPESKRCDVWALGVTLYTMLYGHLPFDSGNLAKYCNRIVDDDIEFDDVISVPAAPGGNKPGFGMDYLGESSFAFDMPQTAPTPRLGASLSENGSMGVSSEGSGVRVFPLYAEWIKLLKGMLCKDPAARIDVVDAYHQCKAMVALAEQIEMDGLRKQSTKAFSIDDTAADAAITELQDHALSREQSNLMLFRPVNGSRTGFSAGDSLTEAPESNFMSELGGVVVESTVNSTAEEPTASPPRLKTGARPRH
jgi:serine/threonine protein kinase